MLASDTSITVAAGGISVNTAVIVPNTRTLTAGNGLTGGGDLSANRTFTVLAADTTISVTAGGVAVGTPGRLPLDYQSTSDATRTTTSTTAYPGAVKLTMTTPALTGTYRVSWSSVVDYSSAARDLNIRLQNTTDAVTLEEMVFRPTNAVERAPFGGFALVTFTGAAKTFQMQFHGANAGDTAGCASAYLDFYRVA